MTKKLQNVIGCFVFCFCFCLIQSEQLTIPQKQNDQTTNQQTNNENDYNPYLSSSIRDDFDLQLLKDISALTNRNTIISPISIKLILALLYEGSGGNTETELQNLFQLKNKTDVRYMYANILNSLLEGQHRRCDLDQDGGVKTTKTSRASTRARLQLESEQHQLNLATRIYLDQKFNPEQAFESKACENYRTKVNKVDFESPVKVAEQVNHFVNASTHGKISKLVDSQDVAHAVMVIVNALYFHGLWEHQFPREHSHYGGFYVTPTQAVQVPFMSITDEYFYGESAAMDAKILRIPFKGNKYSMFIVLPNAKAGLTTLLERVNALKMRNELANMSKHTVSLVLPKFKFDCKARLSETLKNLGIKEIFETSASLPGIVRGSAYKLQVSDVIQKAGIEVNEEGSTAFAASEITLTNKFGESQAAFNATHPFLFYIEDQVSHTVLFMGKVLNPLDGAQDEMSVTPLPARVGDDSPAASKL